MPSESETTGASADATKGQSQGAAESSSQARASTPYPKKFSEVVDLYCQSMEAVRTVFPLLGYIVQEVAKSATKEFNEIKEKIGTIVEEEKDLETISFPPAHMPAANRLFRYMQSFSKSTDLIPGSFLMTLVSIYDAFLSQLIGVIFQACPDLLSASDKKLSLADLAKFNSLEDARQFVIEKEVESVMRDNHAAHFSWLQSKLKLELRVDLPVWPTFIEVTERRNLFTHTGGIVSSQYLVVCRAQGVDLPGDVQVGKRLYVSQKYFEAAHDALFEIGVKLTHVCWRKLMPNDGKKADENLNSIAYDLLKMGQYKLAATILDFAAVTVKKHSSDKIKRMIVVNRAQAYKHLGDDKKAVSILDEQDWSSCTDEFHLCVAVLKDDFGEAVVLMKKLGVAWDLGKMAYADWPIFNKFRRTDEFKDSYRLIYGEEFVIHRIKIGDKNEETGAVESNTASEAVPKIEDTVH